MRIAALDIGGTAIKSSVYEHGTLQTIEETATNGSRGASAVIAEADGILRRMGAFDAIGVSTRGQVDCDRGVILFDPPEVIPGYTGTNLRQALSHFAVPVAVENDVNCVAVAEARLGAGRGVSDLICLTYGTAIGGAIVQNGAVRHGASWSAGEFGMLYLRGEFYENLASAAALVRMAQKKEPAIQNGRDVAARLKEPGVLAAAEDWAELAAEGLASLIHALDPGAAVLGGGVMEDPVLFPLVRERTRSRLAPGFCCDIRSAAFGNRAGLLGAALLAEEL